LFPSWKQVKVLYSGRGYVGVEERQSGCLLSLSLSLSSVRYLPLFSIRGFSVLGRYFVFPYILLLIFTIQLNQKREKVKLFL
jgi:hypothetical protein